MSSMRTRLMASNPIFINDIMASTILTCLVSPFHFFAVRDIIFAKSASFLTPMSLHIFEIIALFTTGMSNCDSTIMRRMRSTSTPCGCGLIMVGGGGISFTNLGCEKDCPFGSSNFMVAYGVISDVSYT